LYQSVLNLRLILENLIKVTLADLIANTIIHWSGSTIPLLVAKNIDITKTWSFSKNSEWKVVLPIELHSTLMNEVQAVSILAIIINGVSFLEISLTHNSQHGAHDVVIINVLEKCKFIHQFAVIHE
jgi:hypothetical protein